MVRLIGHMNYDCSESIVSDDRRTEYYSSRYQEGG